ncbi:MAG: hypothetical protein K2Y28_04050, partial [Burkholderiaceae bacterium]|nr:hypothetical protein [Burkholderiaceae bacterium]
SSISKLLPSIVRSVCVSYARHVNGRRTYSISKSIVSMRRAADSAVARQGEGNNDSIDLEMELHLRNYDKPLQRRKFAMFGHEVPDCCRNLLTFDT